MKETRTHSRINVRARNRSRSSVNFLALGGAFALVACQAPGSTTGTSGGTATGCPVAAPTAAVASVGGRLVSATGGPRLASSDAAFNASGNSSGSAAGSLRQLTSHIPRRLMTSSGARRLTDRGAVTDPTPVALTLSLRLNSEADLDSRLAEIYRPGSSGFHRYLTPDEFSAAYAPTEAQVDAVTAYLSAHGVAVASVSQNHLLVHAEGPPRAIGEAFHTELHQFTDELGARYRAPAYELQVPAELPIQGVHGLQTITRFRRHVERLQSGVGAHGSGLTAAEAGLSPAQIRTAYTLPTSLTGTGQVLALFELDGYTPSDIAAYEAQFSLPAVPLANVLVDEASGSAGDGASEVELDIELMAAVAPDATQILVYEGPDSEQGVLDTYNRIATDNLAHQISTSWGAPESEATAAFLESENTIFKQMAAQGQSIFAASGDSGAYDDGSTLSVDDPSSQPFVVGVGGTTLTLTASGARASESAWNGGSAAGGGGGGGISATWSIPSWQQSLNTSANLASATMRNVPDVALDADPGTGYAIYTGGAWETIGGTSCAAPLWAAFTALVNQARGTAGLAVLGFPNPALYAIGRGSSYGTDFFDVNDGTTNLYYPAVTGYDDATGWGSFGNAQDLLGDLSQNPAPISTGTPTTSTGTGTGSGAGSTSTSTGGGTPAPTPTAPTTGAPSSPQCP